MACTCRVSILVASLCLALLTACGGDEASADIPAPPVRDKDPKDEMDAGEPPDTDEDAGDMTTIVPFDGHCDDVELARLPVSEAGMFRNLLNTSDTPEDYEVTRVEHRFDCDRELLIITFGGGTCTRPKGPSLELTFDAAAIQAGDLSRGQITVTADAPTGERSRVSIRYRRPDGSNAGVWGTCGVATGTVDLLATPQLAAKANYEGIYSTSLPPCDSTTGDPVIVQGTFGLRLQVAWASACGQ